MFCNLKRVRSSGSFGLNLKMQNPGIFQPTKPHFPEQEKLKCPRCDSSNTKFCYYNNYNLSQSRHFCKNCRRYWTKGGALRNIPVGGGTRKNTKRASNPKHSSSSSTSSLTTSNLVVRNTGPEHDLNRIYGATVGDQDRQILDILVFRQRFWFKRERATEREVCSVAHNGIFPLHCGTTV